MGRLRTIEVVDQTLTAALAGGLGAVLGGSAVLAWRISETTQRSVPQQPEPAVPAGVTAVLAVLRSSALVIGPDDEVLKASAPAHALGLVRGDRLVVDDLVELVRQVRRDGQIREGEFTLRSGRTTPPSQVAARVAPLSSRLVLVLVEDRTRERRVDAIRRDFVVNVSHELKTPIGAIMLLAEAVDEAAEDPEAVIRFAGRMRNESERLSRLVQQIIELSRLQGDDPLERPNRVDVDTIIDRAIDRSRVDAQNKDITLERGGQLGLCVLGNGEQVLAALGNLVENAVDYSSNGCRVVVTAKADPPMVGLTVTDQGIGIPPTELDRIFERFYRVDPARARTTGGTGLGLSIVKHVAASHGGEVRVWSVEGEGSSFTLSLPAVSDQAVDRPSGTQRRETGPRHVDERLPETPRSEEAAR